MSIRINSCLKENERKKKYIPSERGVECYNQDVNHAKIHLKKHINPMKCSFEMIYLLLFIISFH